MTLPEDAEKPARGKLASQLDIMVADVEPATFTAFLVGLSGHYAGKLMRLKEGDSIIGRSPNALVSVDEKAVSQHHARLIFRAGQCVLLDLNSTNGTFVNDARVVEPVELHAGDVIRVGKSAFGYLTDADDQEQHTRALARVSDQVGSSFPLTSQHSVSGQMVHSSAESAGSLDAALDKLALGVDFVRAYWKSMLLSGVLLALVGASTMFFRPPKATSEFLISLRHQGAEAPQGRFAAHGAEYFGYPEANFVSTELVRETMKTLKLPTQPAAAVLGVARSLQFYPENHGVYRGKFTHADVELAERFLAAHLQNYLQSEIAKSLKVLSSEVELLRKQYEDNEESLRSTGKKLKSFKEMHLAGLPEHATAQLGSRAELQARALELRASLDRHTQELALSKRQLASGDVIVAGKVDRSQSHSAALAATRQNLAAARGRGLTDAHPDVERLLKEERELAALERTAVSSATTDVERQANREHTALVNRIGQLEVLVSSTRTELGLVSGRLGEIEKVAATMPAVEAEFAELSRSLSASQNLHQHLYEQLKAKELQLEFERASAAGRYELLEPLSATPVQPARAALMRAGAGGGAGLFLGACGAALHMLLAYMRRRRSGGGSRSRAIVVG